SERRRRHELTRAGRAPIPRRAGRSTPTGRGGVQCSQPPGFVYHPRPMTDSSSDSRKPRLTANDFHPEVLRLFDAYVHGGIDRRGFLDRAARFAAAGVTAAGLLDALSPK